MDRIEFAGWTVACDVDATRLAYAEMPAGGPEECGCLQCRNYAAARPLLYPPAVLALFEQLGIDPTREAEVYYIAPDKSEAEGQSEVRTHLYGEWFHAIGNIVVDRDGEEAITPGFHLMIIPSGAVIPASFSNMPLFRIEFSVHVPWVIHEAFAG